MSTSASGAKAEDPVTVTELNGVRISRVISLQLDRSNPAQRSIWRVVNLPPVALLIGWTFWRSALSVCNLTVPLFTGRYGRGWLIAYTVLFVSIFILSYFAFVRLIERRSLREFELAGWWIELSAGLLAGTLLVSTFVGLLAWGGAYSVEGVNSATLLPGIAAQAIVSGVAQELLYRGLIFQIAERWLGSWMALSLLAILFAAPSLAAPSSLLDATADALESGIMPAALYMFTRRLWAPIGLHFAWEFTQIGIYGVRFTTMMLGVLLGSTGSEMPWLRVARSGAQASLPAIFVCGAFVALLLWLAAKRNRIFPPAWKKNTAF